MEFTKQQLVELQAFDRNKLDPATALSYDLLIQSMENGDTVKVITESLETLYVNEAI